MISTNNEEYLTELQDLCKLFGEENIKIDHNETRQGERIEDKFVVNYDGKEKSYSFKYVLPNNISELQDKSLRKRYVKNHL